MTTQEFKKQVGKYLGAEMRKLGFKGSGFDYRMESDEFIFIIGIQGNRYGGSFCAEFGIHPKSLTQFGPSTFELSKLKYYDCVLRSRIAKPGKGDMWWNYTESEENNLKTIDDLLDHIQKYALPLINDFIEDPEILNSITIRDLKKMFKRVPKKLRGYSPMTTNIRLSWLIAVLNDSSNPKKAKEFAEFSLKENGNQQGFFGLEDLERIVKNGT